MKVAIVFVLLFATVLCRPARKVSVSSSESSEEVVRRPAAQPIRRKAADVPAAPVQNVEAAATTESDESTENSDEQAAAEALVELKSDSTDTTSSPDTASVDSQDSEDSDDDDDDDEAEESETDEDESSDSSESGESSTPAPATDVPVVVTEEPAVETTAEPIVPTIVTDSGRGDSLGGYPSEYKSIVYVEDKSYHKVPAPYKSYEFMGKKMAYDMTEDNEVEKSVKMYKALQVHSDLMEEDTSTPEVESQGLDVTSGTSQDQDVSPRQASIPEEEESASASDATTSESSSTPEEEEESASTTSDSASTSQESEDEESQSSEEATATPGAADSESDESDESDSDEQGAGPDATTDIPVVITAK
ncbi:osteopontin [Plectropomus leopardus]|uniref:osteopontin n=1 Tax=Plectropomus leopardus TaxID=160734 RepID=UPI001C4BB4AD|nr:osteopontin [Plectropomus leopardus]